MQQHFSIILSEHFVLYSKHYYDLFYRNDFLHFQNSIQIDTMVVILQSPDTNTAVEML